MATQEQLSLSKFFKLYVPPNTFTGSTPLTVKITNTLNNEYVQAVYSDLDDVNAQVFPVASGSTLPSAYLPNPKFWDGVSLDFFRNSKDLPVLVEVSNSEGTIKTVSCWPWYLPFISDDNIPLVGNFDPVYLKGLDWPCDCVPESPVDITIGAQTSNEPIITYPVSENILGNHFLESNKPLVHLLSEKRGQPALLNYLTSLTLPTSPPKFAENNIPSILGDIKNIEPLRTDQITFYRGHNGDCLIYIGRLLHPLISSPISFYVVETTPDTGYQQVVFAKVCEEPDSVNCTTWRLPDFTFTPGRYYQALMYNPCSAYVTAPKDITYGPTFPQDFISVSTVPNTNVALVSVDIDLPGNESRIRSSFGTWGGTFPQTFVFSSPDKTGLTYDYVENKRFTFTNGNILNGKDFHLGNAKLFRFVPASQRYYPGFSTRSHGFVYITAINNPSYDCNITQSSLGTFVPLLRAAVSGSTFIGKASTVRDIIDVRNTGITIDLWNNHTYLHSTASGFGRYKVSGASGYYPGAYPLDLSLRHLLLDANSGVTPDTAEVWRDTFNHPLELKKAMIIGSGTMLPYDPNHAYYSPITRFSGVVPAEDRSQIMPYFSPFSTDSRGYAYPPWAEGPIVRMYANHREDWMGYEFIPHILPHIQRTVAFAFQNSGYRHPWSSAGIIGLYDPAIRVDLVSNKTYLLTNDSFSLSSKNFQRHASGSNFASSGYQLAIRSNTDRKDIVPTLSEVRWSDTFASSGGSLDDRNFGSANPIVVGAANVLPFNPTWPRFYLFDYYDEDWTCNRIWNGDWQREATARFFTKDYFLHSADYLSTLYGRNRGEIRYNLDTSKVNITRDLKQNKTIITAQEYFIDEDFINSASGAANGTTTVILDIRHTFDGRDSETKEPLTTFIPASGNSIFYSSAALTINPLSPSPTLEFNVPALAGQGGPSGLSVADNGGGALSSIPRGFVATFNSAGSDVIPTNIERMTKSGISNTASIIADPSLGSGGGIHNRNWVMLYCSDYGDPGSSSYLANHSDWMGIFRPVDIDYNLNRTLMHVEIDWLNNKTNLYFSGTRFGSGSFYLSSGTSPFTLALRKPVLEQPNTLFPSHHDEVFRREFTYSMVSGAYNFQVYPIKYTIGDASLLGVRADMYNVSGVYCYAYANYEDDELGLPIPIRIFDSSAGTGSGGTITGSFGSSFSSAFS